MSRALSSSEFPISQSPSFHVLVNFCTISQSPFDLRIPNLSPNGARGRHSPRTGPQTVTAPAAHDQPSTHAPGVGGPLHAPRCQRRLASGPWSPVCVYIGNCHLDRKLLFTLSTRLDAKGKGALHRDRGATCRGLGWVYIGKYYLHRKISLMPKAPCIGTVQPCVLV